MKTFAERLKIALEKRELSQAHAAKQCGISQQSINYIIQNNLNSSKLATQISSGLNINPEWLIFGRGRFEETKIYEIPVIHSIYMLKKYLNEDLSEFTESIVTQVYLGDKAFSYLFEPNKLTICKTGIDSCSFVEYLTIENNQVKITKERSEFSFQIYEWRIRYEDF